MYERRFGITGPPFQLSPDPSFYFDGGQHRQALAALRRAFASTLPFIVLSGEIGAGKTTVLRTWLAELQRSGLTSALITNTQLDSEELLSAVALSLGVGTASQDGGGVLPVLRRHMRGLRGSSIAIAIDEAQNLGRSELSSLVDLVQACTGEGVRLRIVLAGQPELRSHLADPALPQLQALIQYSCHLEPFGPDETRNYIEHRLLKVGWSGSPSFEPAAFDEIHRLAGGVPRRVNVLANRLLLGQFLSDTTHVDARAVRDIAGMLDAEIADGSVAQQSSRQEVAASATGSPPATVLLLVVSGRSDYIKAMALMSALQAWPELAAPALVCLRNKCVWDLNFDLHGQFSKQPVLIDLTEDAKWPEDQLDDRVGAALDSVAPRAMVAFDGDRLSLRCAALAQRCGVPLVQIGADPQLLSEAHDPSSPRAAIGRLADLRFACQAEGFNASGGPVQTSKVVGSLLVDALHRATQLAQQTVVSDALAAAVRLQRDPRRGFGVVVLKPPAANATGSREPELLNLVNLLKKVSRDLPLIWPMRGAATHLGRQAALARELEGDRIAVVDELGYLDMVSLMRESTCVLTDSADVAEETAILRVPCISLGMQHVRHIQAGGWLRVIDASAGAASATRAIWQILYSGVEMSKLPPGWDGHTGFRILGETMQWIGGLAKTDLERESRRMDPGPPGQRHSALPLHSTQSSQSTWSLG